MIRKSLISILYELFYQSSSELCSLYRQGQEKRVLVFFLFNLIIAVVVSFLSNAIGIPALSMIVSLAFLVPGIAVGVRRMHDVGKSGWYLLIPIYNLILACTEGEKGSNQYGPDPKALSEIVNV